MLIFDASHNPEGAQVLAGNLAALRVELDAEALPFKRRMVFITGVLGAARAQPLLETIARYAAEIHLVVPQQARACSFEELEALVPGDFLRNGGIVKRTTVEALFPSPGVCSAGGPDDVIVVTGSIYLLGEVMTRFEAGSGPGEGRLQDF